MLIQAALWHLLQHVTQSLCQPVEHIGSQRALAGEELIEQDRRDAGAGSDRGQREFSGVNGGSVSGGGDGSWCIDILEVRAFLEEAGIRM